ncbi:multifunctional oxoglutarate decarboxylase/oxoglutarate dehydrogenase thiamine pyrophosphate-binding subunit/dihydrolipoyllysine-residue succinyltransferase subunit [Amnibacterium setariae]|uniref:2-oxoglutarate dehydrogenase E1 component n=1 Tax=Amnibacterium setariae TaxID=2306585 RepID=A0A3A1U367_9MICO|nr:multifunctional oxoglutarate decarboxylase/oxoglutarate dehydrogenase thiamine pyrophosphate-binding subunit/dihydrolipoyllysine-residue succinyltransferase subunit [Amnibacterium setariae]RIX31001.1 multifunctional oxoglutarate decarboxylase/oxoglutarate dehydrogenase thiamine pyrophosphate-binding subunit/dihydrolipoyllysine-residue succinyltransferase subunit [Amnibacterium setariae]
MSDQLTGTEEGAASEFGANEWLVDELYERFIADKDSVDRSWWPILQDYRPVDPDAVLHPQEEPGAATDAAGSGEQAAPHTSDAPAQPAADAAPREVPAPPKAAPAQQQQAEPAKPAQQAPAAPAKAPAAQPASAKAPAAKPIPADAPASRVQSGAATDDTVTPLRGMAKALATNMDASLSIPTATSVRTIPAKLMIDNRIVINNHLRRARGGKVSFTHLIGWALVKALIEFPSQNVHYAEIDGKASVVQPGHINLGLAIDIPKPDGSRALLVPSIKRAETMNFAEFVAAYDDLVRKARANKLTVEDFGGTTISLTNPGGIGTVHSVPRLTVGQGAIIGAGALEYPAQFQGASEKTLIDLGISKTITLTSTYDHRVIQGAGSGEFLRIVHQLLIGEEHFYEEIFSALRVPSDPIHWAQDINVDLADHVSKTARVQELINAYRVRGHLLADVDPLVYQQRSHPDLDIRNHGLTFWDLDREFVVGGFAGKRAMRLRDVLGQLRDSYCRTVGVEYMHIQDPSQRTWFQAALERPYAKPTHAEQMRILGKLNQAEAFETFLQTKYVGQKRFSLEGSESLISLLDTVLQRATEEDALDSAAIGMAHRGRLNVLTNICGKTYGQIFREFEGTQDPKTVQGSGDVKYHLGTEGEYVSATGETLPVTLAANPSHLETVDGVLEGIVRAKQDRDPVATFRVLPILIHGDAAMAGQGVVVETLQMSQLRAYRTGGTVHIIVNNQVGFTTSPSDGRTSIYASDVAKTIQAPIFHVNGDDPEAVARVAELAFAYRQEFHRDVVVDLVTYRRRGHNEGDDPSMTQPVMYNLVEAKRSVRKLYTEALVGRGDITQELYDDAHRDFQSRLEQAFAETHEAQTASIPVIAPEPDADSDRVADLEMPSAQRDEGAPEGRTVDAGVLQRIGDRFANPPEGFTVHPKLQQLLAKRAEMTRSGGIDWAWGELLAFGTLLLEGTPVRIAGQDSGRGTFVQRHAVLHDRETGAEWTPLAHLSDDQAPLWIYDSLLSEYAALAFEYGYSVERPEALVLWEAQFGDFVNGAQIVIDEYISASEQKWGQRSSVVLLLPHGYDGQGPDHSSARIERFLQLAAQDNMTIAQPSTPASYFHLLRRQAVARPRRPLIVFSPKSMLRLRSATSGVEDFTEGGFQPVIDDARIQDPGAVTRVVLHAGKIHYDLAAEAEKRDDRTTALVRVEQYYPVPRTELAEVLGRYPNAEVVWAQDEPANQGAAPFVQLEMLRGRIDEGRGVRVVSRPASASPAAGSAKRHQAEQADLIQRVFAL